MVKLLLEFGNPWTYERLHGTDWAEVAKAKHPPAYELWQAAQFPPPDEKTHGKLGACTIAEGDGVDTSRGFNQYYVHGLYADGTVMNVGPVSRAVASAYIRLHRLSMNNKEWDKMKNDGFKGIQVVRGGPVGDSVVIKLSDGYWLKGVGGPGRIGPFTTKALARTYALVKSIDMLKGATSDREDKVAHLTYPVFFFEYRMRNIPCADIVCAENLELAMKRFDFQWHVFDNTRPTVTNFTSIDQLSRSLKLLRITDINIIELNAFDLDYYVEEAAKIGNPFTHPDLMKYCRNPRFKYILGRDQNTGRSPVKITW